MTSKAALALGCALIGTLLLTGLRLSWQAAGDAHAVRERSGSPAPAPALEAALAALEAENAALRDRVDAIDRRLEEATREAAPRAAEAGSPAPDEADTAPSGTVGEVPPEEQLARLERAFLAGGSDGRRSFELESALRSALDELALSPGALSSAACGGTLCRAELILASGPDRDRTLRRIPDLLPWESDGFAAADPADPDRLIVYLTPVAE